MNILLSRLSLLVLLLPLVGMAEPFPDLFDDQHNIYTAKNENANYRLTLSALKKINSEWLAEREQILHGKLQRRTVQIEHQLPLNELWLDIQGYFKNKNTRVIFECGGLDCGSSNAWANARFEVKQLYGLDVSQFYQVWEFISDEGKAEGYAVAYLVERGDRRTYLQLDHIIPKKIQEPMVASSAVLAKEFYLLGQMEVPGLQIEQGNLQANEAALLAVVKALNQQPFKNLMVVGHDYQGRKLEDQMQRSLQYAQDIMQQLAKLGVNKKRMEAHGVGSLAPSPVTSLNKTARVVVVIK
ncbi:hypothetical protein TDB9533_02282 [Thalassocella blandensis]|nr:hypothetical protein TDB9533_02282 [Thalassocella blandensis]